MTKNDAERYVILESSKFRGAYVVLDRETMEETPFYNLASAKTHLKNLRSNE